MTESAPPPTGSPLRRRLDRADEPDIAREVAPGPAAPQAEALQPIPAGNGAAALVPAAGDGTSALPAAALVHMAQAFQANAEALQAVHAAQAEIARAIRRTDRAEAIVASTNALNETFRGLATIQREILERLDEARRRPPGGRLVPLLLLGLLVVFVGGIAAVVHLIDSLREERTDPLEVAREMEAARGRGRDEAVAEKDREVARAEQAAEEAERRLSDLQGRHEETKRALDEALAEQRGVEAEQQALADQMLSLRNEAAARKALEDEMKSVSAKLLVLEPRLRQLQADLDSEKAEKARLLEKFAAARMGIPDDDARADPSDATEEDPLVPPIPSVVVSRDERQIAAILERVNRFLDAAAGRGDRWHLRRVEGVSADRLHGVAVFRYDPNGRLLEGLESKELIVWIDREARRVDFEFRDGDRLFDNARTPFPSGVFSLPVAEGPDAVRLWSGSGLLFLKSR